MQEVRNPPSEVYRQLATMDIDSVQHRKRNDCSSPTAQTREMDEGGFKQRSFPSTKEVEHVIAARAYIDLLDRPQRQTLTSGIGMKESPQSPHLARLGRIPSPPHRFRGPASENHYWHEHRAKQAKATSDAREAARKAKVEAHKDQKHAAERSQREKAINSMTEALVATLSEHSDEAREVHQRYIVEGNLGPSHLLHAAHQAKLQSSPRASAMRSPLPDAAAAFSFQATRATPPGKAREPPTPSKAQESPLQKRSPRISPRPANGGGAPTSNSLATFNTSLLSEVTTMEPQSLLSSATGTAYGSTSSLHKPMGGGMSSPEAYPRCRPAPSSQTCRATIASAKSSSTLSKRLAWVA